MRPAPAASAGSGGQLNWLQRMREPRSRAVSVEGRKQLEVPPTGQIGVEGRRYLELLAAFDGNGARSRIEHALETVELSGRAGDRVGGYSHGMRQRLGIAAALLRDPKLLLLDEPTTGLDPGGMRDMRLLIKQLASQGITIVLSSHLLAEVEDVCNRVAIVRRGKIVYEGEIADLKRSAGMSYRLSSTDNNRALAVCRAQPGISDVSARDGQISFIADEQAVAELSQALVEAGALIRALAPQGATLEELFFSLTEGGDGHRSQAPAPAESAVQAAR